VAQDALHVTDYGEQRLWPATLGAGEDVDEEHAAEQCDAHRVTATLESTSPAPRGDVAASIGVLAVALNRGESPRRDRAA
jgi:hypothetical protein